MNEIAYLILSLSQKIRDLKICIELLRRCIEERLKVTCLNIQNVLPNAYLSNQMLRTSHKNGTFPYINVVDNFYYRVSDLEELLRILQLLSSHKRFYSIKNGRKRFNPVQFGTIRYNSVVNGFIRFNPVVNDFVRPNPVQSGAIRYNPNSYLLLFVIFATPLIIRATFGQMSNFILKNK